MEPQGLHPMFLDETELAGLPFVLTLHFILIFVLFLFILTVNEESKHDFTGKSFFYVNTGSKRFVVSLEAKLLKWGTVSSYYNMPLSLDCV